MINGDGTIQPLASAWPELLFLGIDAKGRACLVPHSEEDAIVRIDLSAGVPVTGIGPFGEASAPLLLGDRHAGAALVLAGPRDQDGSFVGIGDAADALTVHVSPNGVFRVEGPERNTFAVDALGSAWLTPLRRREHVRFVLNDDLTLSMSGMPGHVLGYGERCRLVRRGHPDRLTFPELAAIWPAGIEAEKNEHIDKRVRLPLASHPGMALGVSAGAGPEAVKRLCLVDNERAPMFRVSRNGLHIGDSQVVLGID